MKIAIIGANGWIGSAIAREATARGHQVIALVRSEKAVAESPYEARLYDASNPDDNILEAAAGAEIVISALGGRRDGDHSIVPKTAKRLLAELDGSPVMRLMWVGGAGRLLLPDGTRLLNAPGFPTEIKEEATAAIEAHAVFTAFSGSLGWTFVSPAAEIFPSNKEGHYRTTRDDFLTDENGNSRISAEDFALAFIDEAEAGKHINEAIGFAY